MSSNKLTPEERLKRYKKYLTELAKKEGRELAKVKSVQDEIVKFPKGEQSYELSDQPRKTSEHISSPTKTKKRSLVSPSKRELEELKKAVAAKANEKKKRELSGRSLSMLRVRSRALAKALTEIKVKRQRLERQHDRGIIKQGEYKKKLASCVSEGHELLREKTEIDEEIKMLESKDA